MNDARMLLRRVLVVAFSVALVGCDAATNDSATKNAVPKVGAAKTELHLLDGRTVAVPAHPGHWVLVNYWAQWCEPCRAEIPELNALARARAADVAVYGVNFDGVGGPQLQAQVRQMHIEFPVLVADPGAALGVAPPEVLPTTVLIDPNGGIRVLVGPQTLNGLSAILTVR